MSLYIGSKKVKNLYIGNKEISKLYQGTDLIYQKVAAVVSESLDGYKGDLLLEITTDKGGDEYIYLQYYDSANVWLSRTTNTYTLNGHEYVGNGGNDSTSLCSLAYDSGNPLLTYRGVDGSGVSISGTRFSSVVTEVDIVGNITSNGQDTAVLTKVIFHKKP